MRAEMARTGDAIDEDGDELDVDITEKTLTVAEAEMHINYRQTFSMLCGGRCKPDITTLIASTKLLYVEPG